MPQPTPPEDLTASLGACGGGGSNGGNGYGSSSGHEISLDELALLSRMAAAAGFREFPPYELSWPHCLQTDSLLTTPARYRPRQQPPSVAVSGKCNAFDLVPHLELKMHAGPAAHSAAGRHHSVPKPDYCQHCEHCKRHRELSRVQTCLEPLDSRQSLKTRHRSGRVEVGSMAAEGIAFAPLNLIASLGGRGNMLYNLNQPVGLCLDKSGGVILVDEQNHRLLSYPLSGMFSYSKAKQSTLRLTVMHYYISTAIW